MRVSLVRPMGHTKAGHREACQSDRCSPSAERASGADKGVLTGNQKLNDKVNQAWTGTVC